MQDRGDRHVDCLANHLAGIVDHHHGPIVEISHALVVFLAFLQDEDFHDFARQNNRLERICQLVDVQHLDSLQLRNFIQVEVVRDDFAFVDFRQLDQFQVDLTHGREIILNDLNLERGHFLEALENIQPAATAVALQRVGGIGHQLKLAQHKLRRNNDAIEESGLGNVGNPAVDDDAGVENLVAFLALLLAAENSAQSSQVQQISFARADDQANVGHQQHHKNLEKALGIARR